MALEIRVSNTLPLISFATRQNAATSGDIEALEAEVALKADKATTISTLGLATGGGDLSADRTITVPKATGSEAVALADNTLAITPYSLSFPLALRDTRLATLEGGISWKTSVRAATIAAGTLASSFENGDVVDDVLLVTGDRILIKDQAAAAENGIYTVNASGAPTRATDADTGSELVMAGVAVRSGSVNGGTQWRQAALAPITLGTTPLTWVKHVDKNQEEAASLDDEDASYLRFANERRARNASLPKALVLILTGQSNNASWNSQISGIVSQDAYMAVGGNARQVSGTFHGSFFTSAVVHTEGFDAETPISGAITTLMGGTFSRMYGITIAVGGTTIDTESAGTIQSDLQAAAYRLCDLARAAGYDPVIAFCNHQGEADMVALNSETDYYNDGRRYYTMLQRVAAMAMERPDYVAPIVFHHPIQMYSGTDGAASRAIHNGIRRLAMDTPNAIYGGPSYHFDSNSDRTHQSSAGFRTRGEHVGYLLRRFMCESVREVPLQIVDVAWSGTTATVLFNHEVMRDTGQDWGQNLSTTKQLAGFEWDDNGTLIQITALTISGRKVVLTLASTPTGTLAQQKLRIAEQTTVSGSFPGSNNRSGSQIRVNETGRAAIYSYGDAKYGTHYRWAIPQLCSVRAAP